MRCVICGKILKENELFFGELGTEFENKPLCKKCYFNTLRKLVYSFKYVDNNKINYQHHKESYEMYHSVNNKNFRN